MTRKRWTARPAATIGLALIVPIVALIAVAVTRGVEGPSVTEVASGRGNGAPVIVIKDFAFGPAQLTVAKGTKVTVKNADAVTHTLSSQDGSFDTGELAAGESTTIVLDQSGTFPYLCNIHTSMTGTLVVT